MDQVFIPGNIPSSKNSKQAVQKGGRTLVLHSKTVVKFLRNIGIQHYSVSKRTVDLYKTKPCLFPVGQLEVLFSSPSTLPIKVGFHFIRGTKHKADFHNLVQLIADLLVAFKIIEDDDMTQFLPFPLEIDGKYHSYNKENPGVIIKIIE